MLHVVLCCDVLCVCVVQDALGLVHDTDVLADLVLVVGVPVHQPVQQLRVCTSI